MTKGLTIPSTFLRKFSLRNTIKKSIVVSDRATLFNLLIGLDGYTIATGILNSNLNGDNIVSIPLDIDDPIELVYIQHEKASLSKMGERFIEYLIEEVKFDK